MCQRQKFGEDLITLGTDLKCLARLAYLASSHEIRDKIACAQFISALSNGYIKRILQLENKVSSLKTAVQRAMARKVKVIQENNFSEEKKRSFGISAETGRKETTEKTVLGVVNLILERKKGE